MKKIFLILFILLTASIKKTNAQTAGVPDTLEYLQNIVANKTQFIGQPFSKLIDSLKIQIKFFSPNTDIYYDITRETSTGFSFNFPNSADDMYLTYPYLRVTWLTPFNANQSKTLYQNNDGGGWSALVGIFYATGIIADIQIRE